MLRLRVTGSSVGGVYALGLTSGFASSCCAPVLAGVAAISALAGTLLGRWVSDSPMSSGWCFLS
jgi:cytochrome c biogenesis protein CcdA